MTINSTGYWLLIVFCVLLLYRVFMLELNIKSLSDKHNELCVIISNNANVQKEQCDVVNSHAELIDNINKDISDIIEYVFSDKED